MVDDVGVRVLEHDGGILVRGGGCGRHIAGVIVIAVAVAAATTGYHTPACVDSSSYGAGGAIVVISMVGYGSKAGSNMHTLSTGALLVVDLP